MSGLRKGGTVSVALKVDYGRKRLRVFAGKSGSIGHFAAGEFIGCVQRSIPEPDWEALPHVHTKYVIAVVATVGGQRLDVAHGKRGLAAARGCRRVQE